MIECQDVSFSYPASTLPDSERQAGGALKHISCTIEDGSFCPALRDFRLWENNHDPVV